ncbi:CCA tRNA nucleotidyltransferase 1, mitochondrial-like [Amphiura filiformis]|uniref:CCA tRNA nucleotidyltransferase 1, mitochondrial-like n=1 Tax=Amphiura filiformis TaxID=82378 RepID=UPI003B2271E5
MLVRHLIQTARAAVATFPKYQSSHTTAAPLWSKYHWHAYSQMTHTTMKITTPQFERVFTPGIRRLADIFKQYNYELRIAGGAVRDLLMGKQPHDIDFATTATPEEMKDMFTKEEIRMINTKGEKHGTITARLMEENFEVTTLRIDVVTDGRHAEVEFTTDWQLDAERRDLTINSMFLGLDGTLYDFFNGKQDLDDCKVLFVGNAVKRIQEDYLRILRYFRFYGRIAKEPNQHCADTLQAIRENADGLAGISGERIWMELKKILVGNHAASIMKSMYELQLYPYMGLPRAANISEFHAVYERSKVIEAKAATLLAALMKDENDVMTMDERLKISAEERKTAAFVVNNRGEKAHDDVFKPYKDLIMANQRKEKNIVQYVLEVLKYQGDTHIYEGIKSWPLPVFPVTGRDLIAAGIPKDKKFGHMLNNIRDVWIESDYKLTKDELMVKLLELAKNR